MKLLKNKELNVQNWKNFLNENKYSSPFQTPEYFEFFNSIDNFSADVFAVENNNGDLDGLVVVTIQQEKGIKACFSKRGIIYGGPLFTDNKSAQLLLNHIHKYYKNKLIYIEIRNYFDYSKFNNEYNNWDFLNYLNIQLSVEKYKDIEEYIKSLKYNRRREIQLSKKNKAYYEPCKSEKDIIEIYNILHDLYKNRVKLPLPEIDFFKKMIRSNIFVTFKVVHNDKIIGGAFCPSIENKGIYTMYYCGLRDYDKKIFPTHLAILAVVEYGISTNTSLIDFMGAGKPNEPYGVRKYKLQFGGDIVHHGRYIKVLNRPKYKLGKLGLKILSKLT